MKKILTLLAVGSFQTACCTDSPQYAQYSDNAKLPSFQKMVDDTKIRLQKEEKQVFEEFAFLGLSQCFDIMLPYSGSMGSMYTNGFNGGNEVFPRLISFHNLEMELTDFHHKHFPEQEHYYHNFFDVIKSCQSFYHTKNPTLKHKYDEIINNPKYIAEWEFPF